MRIRSAPLASGLLLSCILALVLGQGTHVLSFAERQIDRLPKTASAPNSDKAPSKRRSELTVAACQWARTAGQGRAHVPVHAMAVCGRIHLPDLLGDVMRREERRESLGYAPTFSASPRSPPLS